MYFTIMTAINTRNLDKALDLSKSGNKYVVSIWDKAAHATRFCDECDTYTEAEALFNSIAESEGFNVVKELDTSDAYAFINSQYD